MNMTPLQTLRKHVTGKIESGHAIAIVGIPAKPRYELLDDMECVVATADRLQDLAYATALQYNRRPMVYDTITGKTCAVPEIETSH
jgi:hypothetical protein